MPLITEKSHLWRIEFAVEASSQQRLVMAVKTKDGEIVVIMITRIVVDVMNLRGLIRISANTASPIGGDEHASSRFRRDSSSFLRHRVS